MSSTSLRRQRKLQGRRLAVIAGMAVGTAAAVMFLAVRLASSPEVTTNLGDEEFEVGSARQLAAAIARDDFPLLFQDLRDKELDIYVHHLGDDPVEGWVAFEARAPGQPRRCQLAWMPAGDRFRDPCSMRTFAASGQGLRQFAVRVESGTVVVDLRSGPETQGRSDGPADTPPSTTNSEPVE